MRYLLLLPIVFALGCTRQVNPGAQIPIYIYDKNETPEAGGFVTFEHGEMAIYISNTAGKEDFARVLAHELLSHALDTYDRKTLLSKLDPGSGRWVNHGSLPVLAGER